MERKIDDETIQKIIKIYTTENISLKDMEKQFNIGYHTISKILKDNNIKVKSKKEFILSDDVKKKIVEMYKSGYTQDQIKEVVGVWHRSISNVLHEYNISTNDIPHNRKYNVDRDYFEVLDTNNKCYVLGFLYADGNVTYTNNRIQLSLQEDDKEILEKIREEMKSEAPLRFVDESNFREKSGMKTKDHWNLVINCKKMCLDLAMWGIIPNKTFKLTYPDFLTEEQHSHFLRGVIDGDGYICAPNKYGNCIMGMCGTYDFCCGAKKIIETTLNIHCGIYQMGNIYKMEISGGKQIRKFLKWLYKDAELYLERKNQIYRQYYYKLDEVA